MRELPLFEPGRRPPDWNEHLADEECAVFLSDVRTDLELAGDGNPRRAGVPSACLVFETQAAAEAYAEQRVQEIEHLRCDLFDRRGRGVPPLATFVHPKYARRLPNPRTARKLLIAGCACFPASLPLFWWDWHSGWALIVPTVLGVNFIITGLRLLFWGFEELAHVRGQESQQRAGQRDHA